MNKHFSPGSFTFGYEAADGSFKEETRGTDCVVRGKYGYVDPDGNKREFTYVSGNPCDPNHPDETEEEPERSEEDSNEPENIPQNYPRRPVKPSAPRPSARPVQTTTHAPTTVFQNIYSSAGYQESEEEEQPEPIQLLQQPQQFQRARPAQAVRPLTSEEVTIRQRPRITVANTTPTPAYNSPTKDPVSITPRPTYRVSQQSLQTQPPATTYRPNVQFITQKPASISYSPSSTPSHLSVEPITKSSYATSRKPIDFANEFQKFQQAHNVQATTPRPQAQQVKVFKPSQAEIQTSNPIYESQLVFDPSTGQYDSALYQQLPQSDGDFSLNHRIQPYVHQPEFNQPHQLFNLEQLQQQSAQPLYHRPSAPPTRSPLQFPQFSQQIYQKEHENTQVLSSQQLYAQQQELQQQQLRQDRLESAKQNQAHRFQLQPQPIRQEYQSHQQPQGFYFVAPQQSSGQIDDFLRGHNIEFN